MSHQDICWHDVRCLAELLRDRGDRVLSGISKLRLTPTLLAKLNTAFTQISILGSHNDFQVASAQYMPHMLSHLYFLHDFVQKTPGLTIAGSFKFYNDPNTPQHLDLNRFRSLRHLELNSYIGGHIAGDPESGNGVKGLAALRSQLEVLVILRAIHSDDLLWDILAAGAVTISPDVVWEKLSQLVVSYCGLTTFGRSLALVENLQWLDVSHNCLSDAEAVGSALAFLPKLSYLNLSFNRFVRVPIPSIDPSSPSPSNIKFLLLSHNYIDDLSGIEHLTELVELNLVVNQIRYHYNLEPLRSLSQLQHVKLAGNPITFHSGHRIRTSFFLPPRAVFNKHRHRRDTSRPPGFLLDGIHLSEEEQIAVQIGSRPLSNSTGSQPVSSVVTSAPVSAPSTQHPAQGKNVRRSRKTRYVDLEIKADDNESTSIINQTVSSLETSCEHLNTKRQVESVIAAFGQDKWLLAQGDTAVQEILGMQRPTNGSGAGGLVNSLTNSISITKPLFSSTPQGSPSATKAATPVATPRSTTLVDVQALERLVLDMKPLEIASNGKSDLQSSSEPCTSTTQKSHSREYYTANESDTVLHVSAVDTSNSDVSPVVPLEANEKEVVKEQAPEDEFNSDGDDSDDTSVYGGDDEDEEGSDPPYLVRRIVPGHRIEQDLFLLITPRYIKEKHALNGHEVQRWLMDTLMSSVLLSSSPCRVQLAFNTVVRSKKEREYHMEMKEAQRLLSSLNTILEARPLSAMNVTAFRCMSCSGEFTTEKNPRRGICKCPTCGSTLMLELDETPLPTLGRPYGSEENTRKTALNTPQFEKQGGQITHSPSDSSIGSAASLESPGSATQPVSDSTTVTTTTLRRCESDIDIISNPSQSSIEVLDDISRTSGTPGRKRSSEERQVVAIPSLLPVPEISSPLTPVAAGLTESSSSGSMTDSVCTAYENSAITGGVVGARRGAQGLASTVLREEPSRENSPMYQEEADRAPSIEQPPVNSLQVMLDGLLQVMSSKIGTTKTGNKTNTNNVLYNYEDFSAVDHRLKLHLYMSILDADEREELQLLLRAEVLTCSPEARFPGLLVLTTRKVYVIKITGPEDGDCVDRWMSRVLAVSRSRIQTFHALPWGAGVSFSLLGSPQTYTFVMRDEQYTSNFFTFLNRLKLEPSWKVETSPSRTHEEAALVTLNKVLTKTMGSDTEHHLRLAMLICSNCVQVTNGDDGQLDGGVLLVTQSALVLCSDELSWLHPPAEQTPQATKLDFMKKQFIRNLIQVEANGSELWLQFLDEVAREEEKWGVRLQSEAALCRVIDAIRAPWEELFSVPLEVTSL